MRTLACRGSSRCSQRPARCRRRGWRTGGTELEDLLNSHPAVLQSAVYGVQDADRMEQVHATVVPAPGTAVQAGELRAMAREQRASVYEPARIDFVDALPPRGRGRTRQEAAPEAGTGRQQLLTPLPHPSYHSLWAGC
ncbi:AMP-binding enzyme [Streptomyces arboris]|uniref:AMP-binding enzyme n=1 Tax=Streptomyces arboris TaxID=2600619 RepID=UPI003C30214B